jgi:HNH endonuclease
VSHKSETPRHFVDRIERLRRRLRAISKTRTGAQMGEISALEWAIPILELYVKMKFKDAPAARILFHTHEKKSIVYKLFERDGNIFYLCNLKIPHGDMTIDHVVALSKGGKDDMINYKLTHELCNLEKGNMSEADYRKMKEKQALEKT